MKKSIIILTAVLVTASCFAAVNNSASIMFPLLDMGVGARAPGMGEAYTAVAGDASALYWNPAGLGSLKNAQLGLTYDKWFMDTYFGQILFAYPFSAGTIGADIVYLNLGSLQGRNDSGALTQDINPYNIGGSLGYGINLGVISVGAALKMISQSTGKLSSTGIGGDAGVLFKTGIFSAGLNLQNIGGVNGGNGYTLPMNIKAGVALKILNTPQNGLLAALDMQYLFKDAFSLSAGAEYVYLDTLAVRLGYKLGFGSTDLEGLTGLSGGVGLKFANFAVDYAIVPYGDLGTTQRAMLTYVFGGPAAVKPLETIKGTKETKAQAPAAAKENLYDAALKLEKEGKVKQAIDKYKEAVAADSKNAEAWNHLGYLYHNAGDKKNAVKCYETYLKLKPSDKKTAEWLKKYKR